MPKNQVIGRHQTTDPIRIPFIIFISLIVLASSAEAKQSQIRSYNVGLCELDEHDFSPTSSANQFNISLFMSNCQLSYRHHQLNQSTKGNLPRDLFDPRSHHDFTTVEDDGLEFERGGRPYMRPFGWKCCGLNVFGKYEDDEWLGANEKRTADHLSVPGEWPVSYHGTSFENALAIAQQGYDLSKCKRELFGRGIYSTPDIKVAAEHYALGFEFDGAVYKFVLQNRVDPSNLRVISQEETGIGEYWLSAFENSVRPYAICIRKV